MNQFDFAAYDAAHPRPDYITAIRSYYAERGVQVTNRATFTEMVTLLDRLDAAQMSEEDRARVCGCSLEELKAHRAGKLTVHDADSLGPQQEYRMALRAWEHLRLQAIFDHFIQQCSGARLPITVYAPLFELVRGLRLNNILTEEQEYADYSWHPKSPLSDADHKLMVLLRGLNEVLLAAVNTEETRCPS